MSKYYKAEDIQELIAACAWRMTLAKERSGEGFVEYDKKVLDVDELKKRLSTLPTIEVVFCKECKHAQYCEQYLVTTTFGSEISDGYEIDFCQHGKRIEE